MIQVDPGAQKTDAFQECRNLLLSKKAHADAIPGLEIQADDVRCTHAAAIAQLDKEQLYYLQAHGLPESVVAAADHRRLPAGARRTPRGGADPRHRGGRARTRAWPSCWPSRLTAAAGPGRGPTAPESLLRRRFFAALRFLARPLLGRRAASSPPARFFAAVRFFAPAPLLGRRALLRRPLLRRRALLRRRTPLLRRRRASSLPDAASSRPCASSPGASSRSTCASSWPCASSRSSAAPRFAEVAVRLVGCLALGRLPLGCLALRGFSTCRCRFLHPLEVLR